MGKINRARLNNPPSLMTQKISFLKLISGIHNNCISSTFLCFVSLLTTITLFHCPPRLQCTCCIKEAIPRGKFVCTSFRFCGLNVFKWCACRIDCLVYLFLSWKIVVVTSLGHLNLFSCTLVALEGFFVLKYNSVYWGSYWGLN